jgi:hypothetical protein
MNIYEEFEKNSLSRRLIGSKKLETNERPIFERPPILSAIVISQYGVAPESRICNDNLVIPTFNIIANASIKFEELSKSSTLEERTIEASIKQVATVESENVLAAISAMIGSNNIQVDKACLQTSGDSSIINIEEELTRSNLIDVISGLTLNNKACHNIIMNPNDFSDVLKWSNLQGFEFITPVELAGGIYVGKFLGIDVYTSTSFTDGVIVALGNKKELGLIPIRDISVLVQDNISQLKRDILVKAEVGIGICRTDLVSICRRL